MSIWHPIAEEHDRRIKRPNTHTQKVRGTVVVDRESAVLLWITIIPSYHRLLATNEFPEDFAVW